MFYSIYECNIKKYYKNSFCSIASFVNLFLYLIVIIFSFIVSYYSQGFWYKSVECSEQPNVTFKKDLIFEIDTTNGRYHWASNSFFKQRMGDRIRLPVFKFSEVDLNFDKLFDRFFFHLELPLINDKIHGMTLLLIFNYELDCLVKVGMEGAALIQFNNWKSLSSVNVFGNLKLLQNIKFSSTHENLEFNRSILPHDSINVKDWKINNILRSYWERSASTKLTNVYSTHESEPTSEQFHLDIEISYPKQTIYYHPSFWHVMKWAWVQYLAFLLVFLYFINQFKHWIFTQRYVRTFVYDYTKKLA